MAENHKQRGIFYRRWITRKFDYETINSVEKEEKSEKEHE